MNNNGPASDGTKRTRAKGEGDSHETSFEGVRGFFPGDFLETSCTANYRES